MQLTQGAKEPGPTANQPGGEQPRGRNGKGAKQP